MRTTMMNAHKTLKMLLCIAVLLTAVVFAMPVSAASDDDYYYQQQFVQLINMQRASAGVSSVTIGSDALNNAAMARAEELTVNYSYVRPNGSREFTILEEYGIDDICVGEDYWAGTHTPEDTVAAWMNNDFFRTRLLDSSVKTIGVGHYKGGTYGNYWVVIFTYKNHTSNAEFAQEVLRLVNIEREKNGLNDLEMGDANLNAAAEKRAEEIAEVNSHTRPDGTSCFTVLTEYHVQGAATGENAAWGQLSPAEVVAAWMASDGHRANILDPEAKKMSVGYYYSSSSTYGHQWIQIFTK